MEYTEYLFNKEKGTNLLWAYMIGLFLLLAIRDIGDVAYNKFILVGYILLFLMIAPERIIIPMMAYIFPLLWGLPYTYILPVAILIYLFKKKHVKKGVIFYLLGLFVLEFIAFLWYPEIDIVETIKYFSILTIFFLCLYEENIPYELSVKTFFFGTAVLMFVIIVSTIKTAPSNWLSLFAQGWFRFGEVQADETSGMMLRVNANSMAYYSVVGVSIGLCIMKKLRGIKKAIAIFLTLLLGIGGALTVSRSWMLVMAICLLLFIFVETKSLKTVFITLFAALILLLFVYKAVLNTPELLEGFVTRWSSSSVLTGNQRFDLISEYHAAFMSNPRFWILGTGVTQYKPITGIYHSFHNAIQQIFVCYGFPGAIIFFAGIIKPVVAQNRRKQGLLFWIPFVAVVGFVQTIQFINPEALMLPYAIAVFMLKEENIDYFSQNEV